MNRLGKAVLAYLVFEYGYKYVEEAGKIIVKRITDEKDFIAVKR